MSRSMTRSEISTGEHQYCVPSRRPCPYCADFNEVVLAQRHTEVEEGQPGVNDDGTRGDGFNDDGDEHQARPATQVPI